MSFTPALLLYAAGMLLFSQAAARNSAAVGGGYYRAWATGTLFPCAQAISIKDVTTSPDWGWQQRPILFLWIWDSDSVPMCWERLSPITGYRGLYVIMTFVILAAIPLYYFLPGKKASSESPRRKNSDLP